MSRQITKISIIIMGIVALILKICLKDTALLMNIVNGTALWLSITIFNSDVFVQMSRLHKSKHNDSVKTSLSIRSFTTFSVVVVSLLIPVLFIIYIVVGGAVVNDLITIFTLMIAMTSDFLAKVLSKRLYNEHLVLRKKNKAA